jgi:hypothetical protein
MFRILTYAKDCRGVLHILVLVVSLKSVFVTCGIWHATRSISVKQQSGIQQAALVSCSNQHLCHAASSISSMQQAE